MKDLISIAIVVATLVGGTITAEKIFVEVRKAALSKAAYGLPTLTPLARSLTNKKVKNNNSKHLKTNQ